MWLSSRSPESVSLCVIVLRTVTSWSVATERPAVFDDDPDCAAIGGTAAETQTYATLLQPAQPREA